MSLTITTHVHHMCFIMSNMHLYYSTLDVRITSTEIGERSKSAHMQVSTLNLAILFYK